MKSLIPIAVLYFALSLVACTSHQTRSADQSEALTCRKLKDVLDKAEAAAAATEGKASESPEGAGAAAQAAADLAGAQGDYNYSECAPQA